MGVLNFSSFLHTTSPGHIDVLSLDSNYGNEIDSDPTPSSNTTPSVSRNKRKRTKSGGKSSQYNFQDYGLDERRRGSKHQRRKQNFSELLELADDDVFFDDGFIDNQMTVFAELFLDEQKMKIWEGFINLSEDKQIQYIEEFETRKVSGKSFNSSTSKVDGNNKDGDDSDVNYLLIDKKIRDMLRSKQLAKQSNGLLNYYENDVKSCMGDVLSPTVLIFNLESAYDRMLVYAICQFMKLSASTIKLKGSTIIEIELDEGEVTSGVTLTKYLQENALRLV